MSETLFVSRFYHLKREANRAAAFMGRLGGKRITVKGKRSCWRVRSRMTISALARFSADEAKRAMSHG